MQRIFAGLGILMVLALMFVAVPEVAVAQSPSTVSRLTVTGSATIATQIKPVWGFTTVGPGALLVWKYDSAVARTFKPCTNTVAQSFTDSLHWGPLHRLLVKCKARDTGWVQTCTVIVTGLDSLSVAKTCTTTIADGDTLKWVAKTWTKIRTVKFKHAHLSDSAAFYGYPINCVTTTAIAKDQHVAGVAFDSMVGKAVYSGTGVDGYGWMVTDGLFPTYLVAGEYQSGLPLTSTTTAGSGGPCLFSVSDSFPGCVFGKAAYKVATAGRWPVWLKCGN